MAKIPVGMPASDNELILRLIRANEPVPGHNNNPNLKDTLFHIMRRATVSKFKYGNPLDIQKALEQMQKLYGSGMVEYVNKQVQIHFKTHAEDLKP